MLVLSRKESERLIINGNIVITVVRIAGGGVRLGIEAPREISIQREELLERSAPAQLAHHQIIDHEIVTSDKIHLEMLTSHQ